MISVFIRRCWFRTLANGYIMHIIAIAYGIRVLSSRKQHNCPIPFDLYLMLTVCTSAEACDHELLNDNNENLLQYIDSYIIQKLK